MTLAIGDITAAVRADLLERGVTAEVLFGSWNPQRHSGANRVIFGLSTFEWDEPGPTRVAGAGIPVGDGTVARPLFDRVQACPVWVVGAAPDPTDELAPELAQAATADLLDKVCAALYRFGHGGFEPSPGEWPHPERTEFSYGSLATFVAKFRIPVLDDGLEVIAAEDSSSEADLEQVDPDGTEHPAGTVAT